MKIDYLDKRFPEVIRYKIFQIEENMIEKIHGIKSYNFIYDTNEKEFYLIITLDNDYKLKIGLTNILSNRTVFEIVNIINEFVMMHSRYYNEIETYKKGEIK